MLNIERVEYILKELETNKTVYVSQLAARYYVSPSTIRRDLAALEKEGVVQRTYGGAILVEHESAEIPYMLRRNEKVNEKNVIGHLAATLVRDGQFIFLDSTSTAAFVVRHLAGKANLKILTTSAQIALDCLDRLNAQIYCTGGWMSSISRGFIGERARLDIADFRPDLLFFSARSLSMRDGITDVNEEDVFLKHEMLRTCRKRVFLCDHTKFNHTSYRIVCEYDRIDCLITDKKPAKDWMEFLENARVQVLYPTGPQQE